MFVSGTRTLRWQLPLSSNALADKYGYTCFLHGVKGISPLTMNQMFLQILNYNLHLSQLYDLS